MSAGHPYRSRQDIGSSATERGGLDRDVFSVVVFVWLASMIRVGAAVVRGESLGEEPRLALLVMMALPWLARVNLVDAWRRLRR